MKKKKGAGKKEKKKETAKNDDAGKDSLQPGSHDNDGNTQPAAAQVIAPHTPHPSIVTDIGLERAWGAYATAFSAWAQSTITMQEACAKASLSWLEACRKALEFDTDLLRSGCAYYEEAWHEAYVQSAKHHAGAAASYAAALCDIQTGAAGEYGSQCRRIFGLQ